MRSTRSSSSDSESSERVQNVHCLYIKYYSDGVQKDLDESYSYKRKLGDLIFDANFEGGNLGFVERIDQFSYDLMVRPDLTNPRHRLWFNFTVSNQLPNQCVIFNFVNLSDYVRLFHEGLTPVARSRLSPNWVRLHEDQVFYYRSPSHAYRYVYSISFRFEVHDNEHQFALFYPYNYTTLMRFLDRWSVETRRLLARRKQQESRGGLSQYRSRHLRMTSSNKTRASGLIKNSANKSTTPSIAFAKLIARTSTPDDNNTSQAIDPARSQSSLSFRSITPTPSVVASSSRASTPITTRTSRTTSHASSSARANRFQGKMIPTSCRLSNNYTNLSTLDKEYNDYDDDDEHEHEWFSIRSMGASILNKSLYHVSISCMNRSKHDNKLNVVILCRPAGNLDAACSFVCQGLIDYMMSDSLFATLARRYINFNIFPMLDPDSVWVGNSRTDLFGQLSNSQRVVRKNSKLYEGLLSIQDYICKLISGQHGHSAKILILDFYVNLGLIGARVIGTCYNEPLRMEKHLSFPRLVSQFSQHFYLENCEFLLADDPVPSGLFDFRDVESNARVDQYRFELSPFASFKRSLAERAYDEFTPKKYFALAKAIAFSFLEMAKPKQAAGAIAYVDELLRAYHQGPSDIDDLKLNLGEFE